MNIVASNFGLGSQRATSAQEALTQLRIAFLLWQEEMLTRDASAFQKNRASAMHGMLCGVMEFLGKGTDGEVV